MLMPYMVPTCTGMSAWRAWRAGRRGVGFNVSGFRRSPGDAVASAIRRETTDLSACSSSLAVWG